MCYQMSDSEHAINMCNYFLKNYLQNHQEIFFIPEPNADGNEANSILILLLQLPTIAVV